MVKHFIMDHTGHTTVEFDKLDPAQLQAAQDRFDELLNERKMVALTRDAGATDYTIARKFEDSKDETLFRPQLVGG